MPFYEYQCKSCGHEMEAMQKVSDTPLKKCPECGKSQLQRLISAPVFRLKGSGWYETDFKGDGDNKRNLADRPDKDAAKEAPKDAGKDAKESKDADAKPKEGAATAAKPGDGAGAGAAGGDKSGAKASSDKPAAKSSGKTRSSKPAAKKAVKKTRAKMPKTKARR